MKFIKRPLALAFLLLAIGACSNRTNNSPFPSISEDAKGRLDSRVSCANATTDIAALEDERASVGKRMFAGVRSVFPISAVAGILMGDYSDRVSVATGEYNQAIEDKIGEIRSRCGS